MCENQNRAGGGAESIGAGDVFAAVERALRVQALQEAAAHAAHGGGARGHGSGRERRRDRTSATASSARSRSSRTTTRARSSPSRALPPASGASSATSSRSARARSRCWIRCASVSRAGARARYLLDGAVSGIGHYGNSIGVPTVGGEVYFEGPYEQNCLVNAMALGLVRRERLVRSAAAGVGNVLVLFGAATGRDGIGGASVLASAELAGEGDGAPDKRPTVQVGDPFEEKKLMECYARAAGAGADRLSAGPRRRRPHLLGLGDGVQGRGGDRHRRDLSSLCASRAWSRLRSWSRSRRSACSVWWSPRTWWRCSSCARSGR